MSCIKYNVSGQKPIDEQDGNNEKLEKLDTLHDMWRTGERGDDIQDVLNDNDIFPGGAPAYVKDQYGFNLTLNQQFEPLFESYIEERGDLPLPSLCESAKYGKVYWTIQELMDDYFTKDFERTVLTNPMIRAIQIIVPTGSDKRKLFQLRNDNGSPIVVSNENKSTVLNYVANCILRFFNSGNVINTNDLVLFAIDANAGSLPCIFQSIRNNVNTIGTALTICDSAGGGVDDSSSVNKCGVKAQDILFNKKYQPLLFPFNIDDVIAYESNAQRLTALNTINTKHKNRAYIIQSNVFTREKYILYYTENKLPFSVQNKCSIVFHVMEITTKEDFSAPFELRASGKLISGTPVVVLRALIRYLYDQRNNNNNIAINVELKKIANSSASFNIVPIIRDMLMQGQLKVDIIKMLLDYKRAGDNEQVNSLNQVQTKTGSLYNVLCTGDVLCSVYSRTQTKNTCYSHAGKLDLFRFQTGARDEEAAAQAREVAEAIRLRIEINQKMTLMEGIQMGDLSTYENNLTTLIKTTYEQQPITQLTLLGLQHAIKTYLPAFEQYIAYINEIIASDDEMINGDGEKFNSISDEINDDNYIDASKKLTKIQIELSDFFIKLDIMHKNSPFNASQNLLGPAQDINAMDTGDAPSSPTTATSSISSPTSSRSSPTSSRSSPTSSRSSPTSISKAYRKAPFFNIDLTTNVNAMNELDLILKFNSQNERRRGNKVMKANVEVNVKNFQELMLTILEEYQQNINVLPPKNEDLNNKIELVKNMIQSLTMAIPVVDNVGKDDIIIYTKQSFDADADGPNNKSKEEFTMSAFEDIMALLVIDSNDNDDESLDINLDPDTDSDEMDSDEEEDEDGRESVVQNPNEMNSDEEDAGENINDENSNTMDSDGMDSDEDGRESDVQNPNAIKSGKDISEEQKTTVVSLRRSPRLAKKQKVGGVNCRINILLLPTQSMIFAGSDAIMPFITSFISEQYPAYYLEFLEKQKSSLPLQSQAANIVQDSINAFPQQSTQPQSINYFDFLDKLRFNIGVDIRVKVSDEAIENAYALLSSSFNNYVYEYLESLTDDLSNSCNTIMDAFKQLPKEVKLLIFITNLIHDQDDPLDKSIYFYGGIYGKDEDVFNNLMDLVEESPSSGSFSNISNTIFYIYEINNFRDIYCAVIQFFGIIKKYYINRNENEEVLITDYVKVADESQMLIDHVMNLVQYGGLARLDFLIGNFLVAPLKTIQTNTTQIVLQSTAPNNSNTATNTNPRKQGRRGGKRTRRIRKSKKRPTHTKRKKHNKKRGYKKLKKRNQKKRTTRRKK